jgi:transposase
MTGMIPETTKPGLEEKSREELIAIIQELMGKIRELEAQLRLQGAPTTSTNSSQAPSRDFKSDKPKKRRRRKKVGAKVGHEKAERPLVEKPNKVIEVWVEICKNCHANLLDQVPVRTIRRQVTELPEIKPVVIETRQHEMRCPCCGELQRAKLPKGLEAGRQFGPRLEALVTNLHHEHHLGFERICQVSEEIFGITLSKGGAVSIVERAGKAAEHEAAAIGEQVRQSKVIGSDETGARVQGLNWWEWVFVSGSSEYHAIVPSRGQQVIEAFMRECQAEVWVSDCWKAQLNAPADVYQICLAHQIRNLQGLIEKRPRLLWAKDMQALFRKAIHLGKRRWQLTRAGFESQVAIIEQRLQQLLKRSFQGIGANLLQRYRKYRDSLFVFLQRSDVPAHNNACERALRPSVIHRKVMGSFRSAWGAPGYAALATVLNTARRNGQSTFHKLVALMGQPVLPFLEATL